MIVKIIAFENLRFQLFPSITSGVFKFLRLEAFSKSSIVLLTYNVISPNSNLTMSLHAPYYFIFRQEELNIDSCSQHNHSLYFVDFVILSSKLSSKQSNPDTIGYIRILGIGMELACNGGSCGELSLKRD